MLYSNFCIYGQLFKTNKLLIYLSLISDYLNKHKHTPTYKTRDRKQFVRREFSQKNDFKIFIDFLLNVLYEQDDSANQNKTDLGLSLI